MDNTRRKAVLNVLKGIAPNWANPRAERWGQQDMIVVDVVGTKSFTLLMTTTGGWFYMPSENISGDTMPTADPEFLGLTRSDGGQEVAGTFMAKVMDALDAARREESLTIEDRMEAHTRLEQILAFLG